MVKMIHIQLQKAIINTHQWLRKLSGLLVWLVWLFRMRSRFHLDLQWLATRILGLDSFSTGALTFLACTSNDALVYIVACWLIINWSAWLISYLGCWRLAFLCPTSSYSRFVTAPGLAIWIRRYMIDLQSSGLRSFCSCKRSVWKRNFK